MVLSSPPTDLLAICTKVDEARLPSAAVAVAEAAACRGVEVLGGVLGDILLAGSKGVALMGDTLLMTGERIRYDALSPSWHGGGVAAAGRRRAGAVDARDAETGPAIVEATAGAMLVAARSGEAGLGDSVSTAMLAPAAAAAVRRG